MEPYPGEVHFENIAPMLVLSGTAVGSEPEDAIMAGMAQLAADFGLDVLRRFGFDSPVSADEDAAQLRGYEYWLVIDEAQLAKLPSATAFDYTAEGTPDPVRVSVKRIPAFRYATLRITDPFADPFARIGGGWQHLADWLRCNGGEAQAGSEPEHSECLQAACLEEVRLVDGATVMDIFIPVCRLD